MQDFRRSPGTVTTHKKQFETNHHHHHAVEKKRHATVSRDSDMQDEVKKRQQKTEGDHLKPQFIPSHDKQKC